MEHDEIERLFRAAEGERVERKRNITDPDAIRETICAFANDLANRRRPSVIFIGQEDDGTCTNLQITDRMLMNISGMRVDGKITPFPLISVEQITVDQCPVICVIVTPTDNPPVKVDNIVFVRVGPTTRRATAQEEQTLVEKRRWGNLPFDAHGVVGSTIDDLDLRRFELELLPALISPDALIENSRTIEQCLKALRMLRPDGTPTVSAILLFSKEPSEFFAGAYVQALRVTGTELTSEIVDQREFFGTIPDQLRQLDEYIQINSRQSLQLRESRHTKDTRQFNRSD